MITGIGNPRVKQLVAWQTKSKARREDGVFVAEGFKMLREAPENLIKEIYATEEGLSKIKNSTDPQDHLLYDKIVHTGYELFSDEVMKKAADTQTPQGIITVLAKPSYQLSNILRNKKGLYLILEDLQDPGNVGTIFRTAEGAGVDGIILSKNSVDIFSPKTIRSTMGSIYRVPFIYEETLTPVISEMKKKGIKTYAAHLKGDVFYNHFDFKEGCAFLIGNEGNGLKKETADLADSYLKIPMEGRLESLNAAVATALLIYEAHRQRH